MYCGAVWFMSRNIAEPHLNVMLSVTWEEHNLDLMPAIWYIIPTENERYGNSSFLNTRKIKVTVITMFAFGFLCKQLEIKPGGLKCPLDGTGYCRLVKQHFLIGFGVSWTCVYREDFWIIFLKLYFQMHFIQNCEYKTDQKTMMIDLLFGLQVVAIKIIIFFLARILNILVKNEWYYFRD